MLKCNFIKGIILKITDIVMNPQYEVLDRRFESLEEERLNQKKMLTAGFRLFGKFGFDEGLAGHITVRDPVRTDHFWVNPLGVSFKQIKLSHLLLVSHDGEVVEGDGMLNKSAFAIHSRIHAARREVNAVAHSHSLYGKSWSSLGRLLDPITQDSCAFFENHVLLDSSVVVTGAEEGDLIGRAIENNKACILKNHGLLTVGGAVEEAVWWFISMERSCQAQLLSEAAGIPNIIDTETARKTCDLVGAAMVGQYSFRPLYSVIAAEQPDMFD